MFDIVEVVRSSVLPAIKKVVSIQKIPVINLKVIWITVDEIH